MITANLEDLEPVRIQALRDHDILDSAFEEQFDEIARMASAICSMPISAISLIDTHRQWFKAAFGLPEHVRETSRDVAFCAHTILANELMEVEDATCDARFADNPLVTGDPEIRHYAGQPLIDSAGFRLGTLCVIDSKPGRLDDFQRAMLKHLAVITVHLIEARKRELEALKRRTQEATERQTAASIIANITRSHVESIAGLKHIVVGADRFSGDMIGAASAPDGSFFIMIADVMGHGLPSALLMSPILASFKHAVRRGLRLAEVARTINRELKSIIPAGSFVAATLIRVDRRHRNLQIWNGGMPDVLLIDGCGSILANFDSQHVALGVLDDDAFDDHCSEMILPGPAQLVALSDGLTESASFVGESFGADRLHDTLSSLPPSDRFEGLLRQVAEFTAGVAQRDDMSLLTLDLL